MRQALGLRDSPSTSSPQQRPDQARQRHRFVQDGEVPVVILNGRKDVDARSSPGSRVAAAQSALEAEQAARASAERALQEAQGLIQSLRTKLAHAELAHSELLAAERAARTQAEQALQEANAAREAAEQQLAERVSIPAVAAPPKEAPVKRGPAARSGRKASAPTAEEPQPVKWWLPSYRTKASKR